MYKPKEDCKEEKEKEKKFSASYQSIQPWLQNYLSWFYSMLEEEEFINELPPTVINPGIHIFENPVIPGCPNAPGHCGDDFCGNLTNIKVKHLMHI